VLLPAFQQAHNDKHVLASMRYSAQCCYFSAASHLIHLVKDELLEIETELLLNALYYPRFLFQATEYARKEE
jgi:hypothetical protein